MKNKKTTIEQKLSFLYDKLEELGDLFSNNQQASFLLEEIDYYKTELLKLEAAEYYQTIEDEND